MKLGVAALHRKLWPIFSRYIRLRDATDGMARCVTCTKMQPIIEMDAGHFESRRWKNTLYHEQNVHAQCKGCNKWRKGEPTLYAIALDKKYGPGTASEITRLSRLPKHWKAWELEEMIWDYKQKVKELENGN